MLRKCENGSLQFEYVALALCMAAAGLAGFRTLGNGVSDALAGQADARQTALGPVTSAQAGVGEALARWADGATHFADAALERTFRGLAERAGGRVFHDNGALYSARFELSSEGTKLFGLTPGEATDGAFVRVSRGTGRAAEKPTVLGLAVQVPSTHGGVENMLMVTAGVGPLGRRILRNSDSFFGPNAHFSSLVPFRLHGEASGTKYLVVAEPEFRTAGASGRVGTDLDEVNSLTKGGRASFRLSLAAVGDSSQSRDLGRVILSQREPLAASDAFKFQQWTNASLTPVGLINRLRKAAYTGSQAGSRVP